MLSKCSKYEIRVIRIVITVKRTEQVPMKSLIWDYSETENDD